MTVRCKFKLNGIENTDGGQDKDGKTQLVANLRFNAVVSGSPENKEFWKWSPNGTLTLTTVNPEAIKALNIGQEYYIDIIPAS